MFVRIAQLRAFFSAGLDGKLTKIKEQMDAAKDFKDFLVLANKNIERFKITSDDVEWYVENEKYGYWTTLPLLQLLYPNFNYSYSNFHIDHIYPKSKFNKDNIELEPKFFSKKVLCKSVKSVGEYPSRKRNLWENISAEKDLFSHALVLAILL